jgi:thioredoxin 1
MQAAVVLTDATFTEEVRNSEKPVVVDFWADWCGPCRMMSPMIDQIAEAYADRIRVGKLDIDKNPETAAACHVMSVPSVFVYVDGRPIKQIVGARSKSALLRELAEFL